VTFPTEFSPMNLENIRSQDGTLLPLRVWQTNCSPAKQSIFQVTPGAPKNPVLELHAVDITIDTGILQ